MTNPPVRIIQSRYSIICGINVPIENSANGRQIIDNPTASTCRCLRPAYIALATARIPAGPQDTITYARARRPLPELPKCVSLPTLDLRESIIASMRIVKINNASRSNQGICHSIKSPSNGSTVNGNGRDSTRSAPAILPRTRGRTNQSIAIGILSSRLSR